MATNSLGSFRDVGAILSAQNFPSDLASLREVTPVLESDYSLQSDVVHLNHGAFGAVTESTIQLESALRRRAHSNPSHFYDHICLPLVRESIQEASDFFQGPVILQPNCTIAMKAILQTFASSATVARLTPIYGATSKLVSHLFSQHVTIDPGFFTEGASDIIQHLDTAYAENPFTVLLADHVASQTGRILPLPAVVKWCRQKNVVSVIDGTQACWFEHDVWPDYYVLSTHKWLGNIKTCAIVRIEGEATVPEPVGISFGHPDPTDRHLWTGMLDYIPYIMLAKALRVYRHHGKEMLQQSLKTLTEGLQAIGLESELALTALPLDQVLLPGGQPRTMCMVRMNRFEEDLQGALEQYGICVSVKSLDSGTYLRISSWVYNTAADFTQLGEFLQYRIRLDYGIGSTPEVQSARKRLQILQGVENQMAMEDKLFSQMTVDAFFHRAEILRHPLIFYYGHTSVFFMNKLLLGMYLSYEDKIDPELESLCAVGVDEMSWDDLALGAWDETPQDQKLAQYTRVKEYRQKVTSLIRSMILDPARELTLPITTGSIWWVFSMGIEHSRIHVETSSVIMAQIPLDMLNPTADMWQINKERTLEKEEVPTNRLVKVSGGTVSAGRALKSTEIFGWDNEFGKGKEVHLTDFEVSEMLVSNAEYEEFIAAGGFDKPEYWSEDGWKWAVDKDCPRFWLQQRDEASGKSLPPQLRTLTQEIDMPFNWPVMCNNYEAEAFCNWKSTVLGKKVRMISHPEFLLLTDRSDSNNYNLNFQCGGSSCPVNKFSEPLGQDGSPIYDMRGNLWQHSRSLLTVLPEFEVHPLYDDFTLPTIDGAHSFIVGGSWTSIGNCAEINARYGFRRHFYQFAGIRYVCSDNEDLDVPKKLVQGEAAAALAENYLDFENPVLLNVQPVDNAMAEFGAFAAQHVKSGDSVLVLNGSVGRLTVEIAQHSSPASILHTDPTANTLDAFLYGKEHSSIRFDRTIEGNICKTEDVEFPLEWTNALASTEISVKQIDIFRLANDILEPSDTVVVDLVQLNKALCPRRGQIPPNLHVLVKPRGRLIIQRAVPTGEAIAAPHIPGFTATEVHTEYCHIAQETRRVHLVSNTHCYLYERMSEGNQMLEETTTESDNAVFLQYEQDDEVAKYFNFHFNNEEICGIPNFPVACSKLCIDACNKHNVSMYEAMDAGCGPGRLGIELSKVFQHVTAYDYSAKFLTAAIDNKAKNMTLFHGDAHVAHSNPVVEGKKFNLIVGANLVDRMANPREWIQNSKGLLADDGLLVIFSPFTWMKDFTKEENWLGGFRQDSEVVWSLQGAIRQAGPELRVCEPPTHVPFAIPSPDGTMCYVYSQCVVFSKKGSDHNVSLTDVTYSSLAC